MKKRMVCRCVLLALILSILLTACTPPQKALFSIEKGPVKYAFIDHAGSDGLGHGLPGEEVAWAVDLFNQFRYVEKWQIDEPFHCYHLEFERELSEVIPEDFTLIAGEVDFTREGVVIDGTFYTCEQGYFDRLEELVCSRAGELPDCQGEGVGGLYHIDPARVDRITLWGSGCGPNRENVKITEPEAIREIAGLLNGFRYYDTVELPETLGGGGYTLVLESENPAQAEGYSTMREIYFTRYGVIIDGKRHVGKAGCFQKLVELAEPLK